MGFVHYRALLDDPEFFKALRNSFVYLIVQVPASIIGGFMVALFLNRPDLRARMFFRGVYFLPVIIPVVVMAVVWQWMYATHSGVFNYFLSFFGLGPVPWLTSEQLSMPSIGIMKIWNDVGFYAVLFLAGLQGISQEVLDAAQVDGVNEWQMAWNIKLPLLNPVVVFAIIMGTLWGLNIFTEPLLMTDGGPRGSSLTTLLYLYQQGFIWSKLGYANAMGVASTDPDPHPNISRAAAARANHLLEGENQAMAGTTYSRRDDERAQIMNRVRRIALYFVLIAGALLSIFPFYWIISTSLKSAFEVFTYPPSLFQPSHRLQPINTCGIP